MRRGAIGSRKDQARMIVGILALSTGAAASHSPMETTCDGVRQVFRDNACCAATLTQPIMLDGYCPTADTLVAYSANSGSWSTCPNETVYASYNSPVSTYTGCVSEAGADPCGWYDYCICHKASNRCPQSHSLLRPLALLPPPL